MWCAFSRKKHKTYNDGVLMIKASSMHLYDTEGKEIGRTTNFNKTTTKSLKTGDQIDFSGKEILLNSELSSTEATADTLFSKPAVEESRPAAAAAAVTASSRVKRDFKSHVVGKSGLSSMDPGEQAHLKEIRGQQLLSKLKANPDAPDALVLWRSADSEAAVVVDPFLARSLRPHQREGVGFLFNCVTGRGGFEGAGCILADEMGLGKTLQALTLLWTLMKQGPEQTPVVRRAVVVVPTSLIHNWNKECRYWLTPKRVDPYILTARNTGRGAAYPAKQLIADWGQESRNYQRSVLITSYEQFRQHAKAINKIKYDLLICDEGHKIKNPNAQISRCLQAAPTSRRIILSGTPIQNDLEEFFTMIDFVNPDLLGSASYFRSYFQNPIVRSREPTCSPDELEFGRNRSQELTDATMPFILKRSADILARYLPPKTEQVVFCRPSALQAELYAAYLRSQDVTSSFSDPACALRAIINLRKIANHPVLAFNERTRLALNSSAVSENNDDEAVATSSISISSSSSSSASPTSEDLDLLMSDSDDEEEKASGMNNDEEADDVDEGGEGEEALAELLKNDKTMFRSFEENSLAAEFSGKLALLEEMLASLHCSAARQKVVIASLFGKTLDIIENLCKQRGYSFLRLDGSVAVGTRQRLVDRFNDSQSGVFVFLLATKAGGVGLNLVGANRLVLFDGDWNPTTDQQAMARIWRDGQQEKCWIYRLLTTGTIDEKIFQRQVAKQALASVLADTNCSVARRFSAEDLKDIFSLNLTTLCDTHDLIRCKCGIASLPSPLAAASSKTTGSAAAARDFLSGMNHLGSPTDPRYDPLLQEISGRNPKLITMVFQSQTKPISMK